MINKILIRTLTLAALAALVIIPAASMAGGNAAVENTPAVSAENSVEGTLIIAEGYGDVLIKPDDGHQSRLKVRPGAVITRNGEPAKLSDLRPGDKVQANFSSKNWVSELHATGK